MIQSEIILVLNKHENIFPRNTFKAPYRVEKHLRIIKYFMRYSILASFQVIHIHV